MKPSDVTEEDISRWNKLIEQDFQIQKLAKQSLLIKELCYAGFWLQESLIKLNCSPGLIVRIQYSAGKYSFGRDLWEAHAEVLEAYKNNELVFEEDMDV